MKVEKRLTTRELSKYIDVPAPTIAGWRWRGKIGPPSFKIGGTVWYLKSDVDRWLVEQGAPTG